jgi:hypothetical protein
LHTSLQWDGLTAVSGIVEKMTHLIIEKPAMDNLEPSALRKLKLGGTSSEAGHLI